MSLVAVILAAGKGTRMGSDLPKVLHPFLGEPLVLHPIRAARAAGAAMVVVIVGHGAAAVQAALAGQQGLRFALQAEQRGTGHAVQCALPALAEHAGDVLILSGDVPRLRPDTLHALAAACATSRGGLALASFTPRDPTGYGRIVRDGAGVVQAIVEQRDASAEQRTIGECNAGVYCAAASLLRRELPRLRSGNAQGEIYLTDLVAVAAGQGGVGVVEVPADEVAGVNTREQLAELEALALAAT
ncbi:NTP transferase domain-containing protein [Nannocystis sp.]|uniref:sugar phosphate nucleotidyltransferase n=1 Tax=Nannocystis sp. TaxID=1962667 RepID=UPI002428214A|nr:NTP transferase domain-containing protein [Nannocystis sp.]MBK7823710.1 NTP transferase domain-containing protein [Nannocystis sp.]MBK9755768.1 NTP transferase domain-containing protein [Nannocystis sp.]